MDAHGFCRMKLELHLDLAPLCVSKGRQKQKAKHRLHWKKKKKIKPDKAEVTVRQGGPVLCLCERSEWVTHICMFFITSASSIIMYYSLCVSVCITLAPKNKTCSWAPSQSALMAHHDWSVRFQIRVSCIRLESLNILSKSQSIRSQRKVAKKIKDSDEKNKIQHEAAWQREELEGHCWPWHRLLQSRWGPGPVLFLGQGLPCTASPRLHCDHQGERLSHRLAISASMRLHMWHRKQLLKAKEEDDMIARRL